jgi:TonB family protein
VWVFRASGWGVLDNAARGTVYAPTYKNARTACAAALSEPNFPWRSARPAQVLKWDNFRNLLSSKRGVRAYNTDRDMLPVVMVASTYPDRAIRREIEGWVLIEFTVDRLGRITQLNVLQSQPNNVLDRAELSAVKRYKYKPRIVNGEPVPVYGVRHRDVFELTQT